MTNKYFGTCQVCQMPDKHLATTKTITGPVILWTRKVCDHCSMVIQIEVDHAMTILRADTYEARKNEKA